MAKDKLTDYSATNASNTDIGGINIDEGMLPSAVNNALREQMTHLKNFSDGTDAIDALDVTGAATVGGNLLVGKTATGLSTTGFQALATGNQSAFISDGDRALILNRKTSDGSIQEFRKDGTAVGNIGSSGGQAFIGGTTKGIRFSTLGFTGTDNAGTLSDGAIDIGTSSHRIKDLYLSGGVYLGGTGSANKLDQYEEGTWTATLTGSASAPSTPVTTIGNYRKIGKFVFVECRFANVNTTGASGTCYVTGFPYPSVATFAGGDVMSQYTLNVNATAANIAPFFANSTTLQFQQTRQSIATWVAASITAGAGRYLYMSMTYPTSS